MSRFCCKKRGGGGEEAGEEEEGAAARGRKEKKKKRKKKNIETVQDPNAKVSPLRVFNFKFSCGLLIRSLPIRVII